MNHTSTTVLLARQAAEAVAGPAKVREFAKPTMGGEDFSFMLNACPGNYMMLGGGRPLFPATGFRASPTLVGAQALDKGCVRLHYRFS